MWKRTADFIAQQAAANQQPQTAAIADSNQLQSLPLSALSIDDGGPPQVTYGPEIPLTSSTPPATLTPNTETESTDPYCQILPGMTECLYPTIIADRSLHTPAAQDNNTLHSKITSELDKYLQEAADRHETQDNYFDRCHRSTNTSLKNQTWQTNTPWYSNLNNPMMNILTLMSTLLVTAAFISNLA